MVEKIIRNVAGCYNDDFQDCAQDIYLDILSKDENKIVEMYDNNQLRFFVTRMVTNNILSKNSPYYMKYKKYTKNSINIDDLNNKI